MHFAKSVKSIVRRFPSDSPVRKAYNKRKVAAYAARAFSGEQIRKAETDRDYLRQLLSAYAARYPEKNETIMESVLRQIMGSAVTAERQNDQALKEEIVFCKLAYGFSPVEFFGYELEGKTADQRRQYVSDRELMEYVYRMNDRIDISLFNDKADTYRRFGKYYDREAVAVETSDDYRDFSGFAEKHGVFVKKKVNGAMGRDVELIDIRKEGSGPESFFAELESTGKYLIEELIVQDKETAVFNESSVNTVKFLSFLTSKGVRIPYCFMKCGRKGSFVDNGGSGGILVGIDLNTGKLDTDGFDEYHTRYPAHPDSGVIFNGYQLPRFDEALALCMHLSPQAPSVRYIGWDLAYTKGKWVVVEGNGMNQLIGPQLVYERGIKQEIAGIMKEMDLIVG